MTLKRATDEPSGVKRRVITWFLASALVITSTFFTGTWWAATFVKASDDRAAAIEKEQRQLSIEFNAMIARLVAQEIHAATIDIHLATQDVTMKSMADTLAGIRNDNRDYFNASRVPTLHKTTSIPGHGDAQ